MITAAGQETYDMTAPKGRGQREGQFPVVAAVAAGGVAGALIRYGAGQLGPARAGGFPWATFGINVVGCAVIGAFLVLVTEILTVHRLVRPFFGTGVLGGFTTFSTYAVDFRKLVGDGHPATGFAYLAGTLCAAMAAVWLAAGTTRRLFARRLT